MVIRTRKRNVKLTNNKKTKKGGFLTFRKKSANSNGNNNTKDFGGHKGAIINGYSIVVNGEDIFISKNGEKDEIVKYFKIIYMNNSKQIHISREVNSLGKLPKHFEDGTKLILKKVSDSFGTVFEDRELAFREYIEKEFESGKYGNFKEHMIRHIPGIVVGFEGVTELYMIQKSVVQEDKGFLLDIKLGNITAFKCDRGIMKQTEALSTNGLLSKSKKQGWRIESLREISGPTDSNIPSKFIELKKSRKKKCGMLLSKPVLPEKSSKMKWYRCTSEYLDELLKQLPGYTITIKLGDFGHPFLRTDNGVESFTEEQKCAKDKDFKSILDNFKKGIPELKKIFEGQVSALKALQTLEAVENLAFVGSSLMIAFEPKKLGTGEEIGGPTPAPAPASAPVPRPRPRPRPAPRNSAPRPLSVTAEQLNPKDPVPPPRKKRDTPQSLINDLERLIQQLERQNLISN